MDVISTRRDQFLHVITVRGDLDLATAGELLRRLVMLAGPTPGPVALDLSQVTFIDCTGLRALTALDRHLRTSGGSMRLAARSPSAARLFELVALYAGPAHASAALDLAAAPDDRPEAWPAAAA